MSGLISSRNDMTSLDISTRPRQYFYNPLSENRLVTITNNDTHIPDPNVYSSHIKNDFLKNIDRVSFIKPKDYFFPRQPKIINVVPSLKNDIYNLDVENVKVNKSYESNNNVYSTIVFKDDEKSTPHNHINKIYPYKFSRNNILQKDSGYVTPNNNFNYTKSYNVKPRPQSDLIFKQIETLEKNIPGTKKYNNNNFGIGIKPIPIKDNHLEYQINQNATFKLYNRDVQ